MRHNNKTLLNLSLAAAAAMALGAASSASAATLDDVSSRGELHCGVNVGLSGFSSPDENGKWQGLDVETCRAISAAVFGDADKVVYTPLTAKERFTALQSGEIDVLSRNTTWTATRDNSLGLNFTTTTFYDGQGFMVAKDLGIGSLEDLNGASICIQSGTTHELNLADYFPAKGIDINTVTFDTPDQTASGFASGRCDVLTSDTSQLSALRLQLPEPDSVEILTELISKEPLGPVVAQGDDQWFDIVKWTVFAMVNAEELGITRDNVEQMKNDPPNPQVARLLGVDGTYGEQLGLSNDWAYNIVSQVGNYGEVFADTVGENSPLGISRGMNALWNEGGILYAPPIR
ncbi:MULTISPECIES: amino acid ABC transporter substrate-binding protein [Halomonas]|uniref:amino acid ABC transporter substrate-binding protein n=1 Tax=Halomonas TaxID=2745 RepID=UPI001A8E66E8|nr:MULTISPECIES: amino acid ABC transporter substrate-binding protein [Halomonas]MBN8413784.1 amino acid ABC transporter substrate-binding protein [Halomonas litopenaei]MBY5983270.1 amino acid ABC transporter substrate-binding protein [Halomonas sp. DP5Y7-2]MBY6206063.1 amino acid ABC transporter substrate-binding protein [Halomonas sp. DP3Y7-2]MBY6228046.1 amino acid ABC transporter substrate-binding protein [Halomonas sp. DP3Y7-1]MCA0916112.1 amino acid ABC transporter substrate-binding prot